LNADQTPTTERLAKALEEAGAPQKMIDAARAGRYDDYKSESPTPCVDLVCDLASAGLDHLRARAMAGEFDAQKWESDAWAESMKDDPEVGPILRDMGLLAGEKRGA
jgi:hypothetical protein